MDRVTTVCADTDAGASHAGEDPVVRSRALELIMATNSTVRSASRLAAAALTAALSLGLLLGATGARWDGARSDGAVAGARWDGVVTDGARWDAAGTDGARWD